MRSPYPGPVPILRPVIRRLLGRIHTQRASHDPVPSAAEITAKLAKLTRHRRHGDAIALISEYLKVYGDDLEFLRRARDSAGKAGSLSLELKATRLQNAAWPEPRVASNARILEGRLNETSAGWEPSITQPVRTGYEPIRGRILHVLKASMPYRQSGYTVRGMYTLSAQRHAGLDVVATTALDFPTAIGIKDSPDRDEVDGIPHLRLQRKHVPPHQPWDSYLDDWANALAPVVVAHRPEIIHVHSGHRGYDSALVALAVGKSLGLPVVYEVRGFFESLWTTDVSWAEKSEVFRRRFDTETRCMRAADAVITLSDSMRSEIIERGVKAARVHVVPNGVDTEIFIPRDRSTKLSQSLGLVDRFVFGYVSNLDHSREGHELLIRAAVELRNRGIPAAALIVGDGALRSNLEKLTDELSARDIVAFAGKVAHADVLDYYALYDAFVVPRVDERAARLVTPLKPFEAMAAQIPVVVSDLPALREIIGEGQRGQAFRAGDVGSLVAALIRLRDDPTLRSQLATAARQWVIAERQWSYNGARYRDIYEEVRTMRSHPR